MVGGCLGRKRAIEIHRPIWSSACQLHARSLHAELLHCHHHCANEFVAALKAEELILPAGFVKEYYVEGDGVGFEDGCQFSEDVLLIFAILGRNEFEKTVTQSFYLLERRPKFDGNWNSLGKASRTSLIQDEERIEVGVWSLHDVTFHFLELSEEERDLFDEIIIALQQSTGVSIDSNTIANIKGMFDEHKDP